MPDLSSRLDALEKDKGVTGVPTDHISIFVHDDLEAKEPDPAEWELFDVLPVTEAENAPLPPGYGHIWTLFRNGQAYRYVPVGGSNA